MKLVCPYWWVYKYLSNFFEGFQNFSFFAQGDRESTDTTRIFDLDPSEPQSQDTTRQSTREGSRQVTLNLNLLHFDLVTWPWPLTYIDQSSISQGYQTFLGLHIYVTLAILRKTRWKNIYLKYIGNLEVLYVNKTSFWNIFHFIFDKWSFGLE